MIVIPNQPSSEATGSERLVLKLLRSVDWGGASARALSSLNLAEHEYQRWGEIDFLLVGMKGLVAIEVKGGDVSHRDGKWLYEDRLGRVVVRGKSPLVQSKDAYFSLVKNYISPVFGNDFATRYPTGFCVILAGMPRRELSSLLGGPEFPDALIGSREDLANPAALQAFLQRVTGYWKEKNSSSANVPENKVKALVQRLRPEFERVRPLMLARERLSEELLALTEEQYAILDHWEGAERIFCASPAGCGKTLIAVEMLRRSGPDAMLVAGSGPLAVALRDRTGLRDQILSIQEIEEMDAPERPVASILLIDEGQQILSEERLAILEAMVEGGISRGKWAWFGDPNYQADSDEAAMSKGLAAFEKAATVRPKLTRNCRNTPEIVTATELVSGVGMGHAVVRGRGLSPQLLDGEGTKEMAAVASHQILEWMENGAPAGSITLLTDHSDPQMLSGEVAKAVGVKAVPWSQDGCNAGALAFSEVDSFRGLESEFIAICITGTEHSSDQLGRILYLGMTRANFALALIAEPATLGRIREQMVKNATKQMGD